MAEVIAVFKALADETRLRILKLLLEAREGICVCELGDALRLPQYRVSRHLGILRQAGLVSSRRRGTWAYYSAVSVKDSSPLIAGLLALIKDRLTLKEFEEDLKRLRERLKLRVDGVCVIGRGR